MSEIFYVYEHWRSDKNECFYVGKGRGHRAHDMRNGRNRFHVAIQEKLKRIGGTIDVRIVMRGLTEMEAFEEEIRRIIFWRSDGAALANLADGGHGGHTGVRHTEEWKRALSKRMTATMADPEYRKAHGLKIKGLKRTDEQKAHYRHPKTVAHIEAMKVAAKGRKRPIQRTEDHRANQRAGLKLMWEKRRHHATYASAAAMKADAKRKAATAKKEHAAFDAAQLRFRQFVHSMIDGTARQCAACGITKAPEQFTPRRDSPHGRHYYCKSCCADQQRKRRARST